MIGLFERKVQMRERDRRFVCSERTAYRGFEKASDIRKEAISPAYDEAKKSIPSGVYPEVCVSSSVLHSIEVHDKSITVSFGHAS